jgi:ATP-binding cassette subfamily F protein 3
MGTIISLSNISLSVGARNLFENVTCSFEHGQRTGLVGRNGSGKSTFLKILAGVQKPDSGRMSVTRDCKVAYLPQEIILTSTKNVIDETFDAHAECYQARHATAALDGKINSGNATEDEIAEYAHLIERLAAIQPDAIHHKAERILRGLGFNDTTIKAPISTLSTGWKMRVVLAQLLLQDADLYLFDEPTNHLDIVAKEWFFEFLSETSSGYVLVCHDKYYLDNLCTSILSLDQKAVKLYNGSFKDFEVFQEELFIQQQRAYDDQQKEIQRKSETIERFRATASKAKMAQSLIKELNRIERLEAPQSSSKRLRLRFVEKQRPGRIVLTAKDLDFHYGEKELFSHASFQIERGQKVALIAPNGTGKTTLFNVLIGKLPLQNGSIEYGHNVEPSLFVQEQETYLNGEKTIWQNVSERCPRKTTSDIRALLGAFLFSGDDINKKVKVLSGGEKNRVGMSITLSQDANFLLLDEPTNHLDIPSKEILLQTLIDCPSTIFFVSHDHDFINRLATHIIELTQEGTHLYHGNYESYLAYKHEQNSSSQEAQTDASESAVKTVAQPAKQEREDRKEIQKLERTIEQLEHKKQQIEASFTRLAYGTKAFATEQEKLLLIKQQLAEATARWEELTV